MQNVKLDEVTGSLFRRAKACAIRPKRPLDRGHARQAAL